MRGKLVVGNWKMTGGLRQNDALLAELRVGWAVPPMRELAVCVPYPYLWQAQAALSDSAIAWGAQNVSEHAGGAYTGEVSAAMVAEFGCRYAIVGHSERRALYGESDIVVAAKATAALAAGLTPIVCVGETLAEREAGTTKTVVLRQLDAVAARLVGLVLLQHGKGADMGAAFGSGSSGSLFGAAGSANFLSRTTAVLATVFFLSSLGLTYFGATRSGPIDVMKQGVTETAPAPAAKEGKAPDEIGRASCRERV